MQQSTTRLCNPLRQRSRVVTHGATRWRRRTLLCIVQILLVLGGREGLEAAERLPDCGAHALLESCRLLDLHPDFSDLRKMLRIEELSGTNLFLLEKTAKELGCSPLAVRITSDDLLEIKQPIIAPVRGEHFVTIAARDKDSRKILVIDGLESPRWVDVKEFEEEWEGEALILKREKVIAHPRLWIPSNDFDLGTLRGIKGEEKEMTLLNIGSVPLIIRSARFSCPCGELDYGTGTISPGGFLKMKLLMDTTNKRSSTFSTKMYIQSNDAVSSAQLLNITGRVIPDMTVKPTFFNLGDIHPEVKKRYLISVLNLSNPRMTALNIAPMYLDPGLTWETAQLLEPGKFAIVISVDLAKLEIANDRTFRLNALVTANNPDYPNFEFLAIGRKLPWIETWPEKVFLGNVQAGQQIVKRMRAKSFLPGKPTLQSDTPEVLRATMSDGTVVLKVAAPNVTGEFETKVRFIFNEQEVANIEVLGNVVEF